MRTNFKADGPRPSAVRPSAIFKGTAITLPNAEAKCKAEGAVVAGLQNKDEAQWMGSTVPTVIGEHGYVWLGLKRTSLCKGKVLYSKCGPLNSFAWSDGSTVGISGYRWAPGEPNNMLGNQDCGVLHSKSEYMDDMACGADVVDSYVCGKVASF
uniref:C-type lectin domain-containing protein n=1 Tax=Caenorhabditis tropicalis TaxID=1561998 RepID=A0A1I7UKL2_9PELO